MKIKFEKIKYINQIQKVFSIHFDFPFNLIFWTEQLHIHKIITEQHLWHSMRSKIHIENVTENSIVGGSGCLICWIAVSLNS